MLLVRTSHERQSQTPTYQIRSELRWSSSPGINLREALPDDWPPCTEAKKKTLDESH